MITFITILNLIALPIFYWYVFVKKRDNYSQYRYKIIIFTLYTLSFNIILCYLFYYDRLFFVYDLIRIFFWIPSYAVLTTTGYFSRKYSNDYRIFSILLFVLKIMNMVLFVPMIIIYLLHNSSIELIYTFSILIPITLIVLFIIYQVLLRKPFNKVLLRINSFSILLFIVGLFVFYIIPKGNNGPLMEYLNSEEYSELLTNKSLSRIANIETNLKDGIICDFVYKDNNFYFVTSIDGYRGQDTIYLTIYSIEDNEVVYQHESKEMGEDNRWLLNEDRFLLEHNNHLYFLTASGLYLIEDNELRILSDATIYDSYFFRTGDEYFIARKEGIETRNAYLILEDSIVFQENLLENDFSGFPIEYNDHLLYFNRDENRITLSTGIIYELPELYKDFKIHTVTEEYLLIEEYLIDDETEDYFYKINRNSEVERISYNERTGFTEYSVYNDLIYPSTYLYSRSIEQLKLFNSDLKSVEDYHLRNTKFNYNEDVIFYLVRFFENAMYFTSTVEDGNKLYIELNTFIDIEPTVEYKYFEFISLSTIFLSILLIVLPACSYVKERNDKSGADLDDENNNQESN